MTAEKGKLVSFIPDRSIKEQCECWLQFNIVDILPYQERHLTGGRAGGRYGRTLRPNNIAKNKKETVKMYFFTKQVFLLYTSAILFGEGIVDINVGICKCNTFDDHHNVKMADMNL